MSKKIYVCKECGYVFPEELSQIIESHTRVFCERCGNPFTLGAVSFKDGTTETKERTKTSKKKISGKNSTLESLIIKLNLITWIPILIVSIIMLFISNLDFFFIGIAGILISLYDLKFISSKIKKKRYNDIVLDAICFGILGCIIFGTGVLLLIKGVLLLIYIASQSAEEPLYVFGLKMKNSLNNFSAFGGIIIIILAFNAINRVINNIPPGVIVVSISFAVFAIIIDLIFRSKIKKKQEFDILDSVGIIFIGIIGCFFAASGIFILLKGVIIFLLLFGNPPEEPLFVEKTIEAPAKIIEAPIKKTPPKEKPIGGDQKEETKEPVIIGEKKPFIEEKKIVIPKEEKEKEIELRLHESLLPVKDEKDKKLVKEYFSKIFTLLSKDLRNHIKDLKISDKDKKELLNELAFLTKEEQIKYIEAIINLYQEQLPLKLIERIRSLPNIKPEHLFKIAEQLKFMDFEEQEKFVQYLENNA
ncbi:MAG: zinc ribbon domain-containing protein [Promethearchaeota archaeon]|nr:MAG: zinc ribbon domain-containing protein [Candidatus Lokiarchaeota archaeon]